MREAGKTEQINIRFGQCDVSRIDHLVITGNAQSRADVVRYAVRRYLDDLEKRGKLPTSKEVHA